MKQELQYRIGARLENEVLWSSAEELGSIKAHFSKNAGMKSKQCSQIIVQHKDTYFFMTIRREPTENKRGILIVWGGLYNKSDISDSKNITDNISGFEESGKSDVYCSL